MIHELAVTMAVAFALIAARMAAFVAVSPFPGPVVPTNVRVGVALLLAAASTPLALHGPSPALGPPLVMAAIGEVLTGAAIGFVFRVGMSAAEVLGGALAHATGLTFASSYDPSQAENSDALTRIVSSAATLVALAVGAHRVVIGAAVGSLRLVPVGGILDVATYAPRVLSWIARSIECGVGLAVPAMMVSVVVQIAIGLVARAAPALQVFSVGLTVSLASGLVVVLAGLRDSLSGLAAHVSDLRHVLDRVMATAG